MNNLFSRFDPQSVLGINLNWLSAITCLLILPSSVWLAPSYSQKFLLSPVMYVWGELKAVTALSSVPGILLPSISLFLCVVLNNALGLLPYVFTASRHLTFTVRLALPLWIGHMLLGCVKTPVNILAHLVPIGTLPALIPFMVLIEIIRRSIRPMTLAVRLAANIIAGHLLLALLGGQGPSAPWSARILVFVGLIALLVLETAVALIQAYVFRVLSTLYLEEVNSDILS